MEDLIRLGYVTERKDLPGFERSTRCPSSDKSGTKHLDFDDLCAIFFVAMGCRLDPGLNAIEWHMDASADKIKHMETNDLSEWELSLLNVAIKVIADCYDKRGLYDLAVELRKLPIYTLGADKIKVLDLEKEIQNTISTNHN